MKIKKYIVRDMQEALKLIREEMGPDAVIISSYRMPKRNFLDLFSPRLFEVTAALDDNKKISTEEKKLIENGDRSADRLLRVLKDFDKKDIKAEKAGQQDMRRNDSAEKVITPNVNKPVPFDIILKNEGNLLINREIIHQWKKILANLEIQESITEKLVVELSDKAELAEESHEAQLSFIKNEIAKLLEPAYRPSPTHKIKTFVGPTGVGKTITMAKLATNFKVLDDKSVALIVAGENGQQPAKMESLRYFGSMAGIPVERAVNTKELEKFVNKHTDKDIIMVDTMGVNSRNTGMMLRLSNLIQALGSNQEIFLVLSSVTKGSDLVRISGDFRKVGYSRLIFTKLDETETCGSILNVVCKMGVPVSFVTYGQNVPDDITEVDPRKLAGLLLGGVDRFVEQGLQARN